MGLLSKIANRYYSDPLITNEKSWAFKDYSPSVSFEAYCHNIIKMRTERTGEGQGVAAAQIYAELEQMVLAYPNKKPDKDYYERCTEDLFRSEFLALEKAGAAKALKNHYAEDVLFRALA